MQYAAGIFAGVFLYSDIQRIVFTKQKTFLFLDIKWKYCKLINLLTDEKIIGKMIKRQDNI